MVLENTAVNHEFDIKITSKLHQKAATLLKAEQNFQESRAIGKTTLSNFRALFGQFCTAFNKTLL
jgi:hypothetical protein